ncbi:MAG TPA: MMPL family transporter [Acidimicrobiales bacterium]|nr:MMPL family transporter [Acidimicrobiales bacterium]
MATYLYRVGRWTFLHRKTVLALWVLLLIVLISLSSAFSRPASTAFSIPGTQSQQAIDLLNQKFPGAAGAAAQMVFAVPGGKTLTDPTIQTAVQASVAQAQKAPQVKLVSDPYGKGTISSNQRIAYATVIYAVPVSGITPAAQQALEQSATPARKAGVEVAFGGGVVTPAAAKDSSEAGGLIIAYIVLAITLGSMVAAGLPLLTALIGVGIGISGINALGAVISLSSAAPVVATMLGLAVAIDYALFILQRYRQLLATGLEPPEAAARSAATAGSAVVFAGLTVVMALCGLAVVNIPFLTVMGLAAAGTVTVAVLIAVTLVPAVIGMIGPRIKPVGASKARRPSNQDRDAAGLRWARVLTRQPLIVIGIVAVIVVLLAAPALGLKLGLPDAGSEPPGSTGRVAYDLLAEGFGPGVNGPLTVVVNAPQKDNPQQVAEAAVKGLSGLPDVASVSPPIQNSTKDVTIVIVTPKSSPTSDQTSQLVNLVRTDAVQVQKATGVEVLVTGPTAVNIDVSNKLQAALPIYLVVVVGLGLLLLALVFRSILVPLKSVFGFLLSILAAMGLVVSIFQDGHLGSLFGVHNTGPVVSFLPIFLIAAIFGLSTDYEVFLVSRMWEEFAHTGEAIPSVVKGYGESARVVVAAGLIMIGVFTSFVFSDDVITKEIGFALAVGVLVDAFLVRLTLVPAVMALLGRRAWWLPHWLDRAIPNVDIEGLKLDENLAESALRAKVGVGPVAGDQR